MSLTLPMVANARLILSESRRLSARICDRIESTAPEAKFLLFLETETRPVSGWCRDNRVWRSYCLHHVTSWCRKTGWHKGLSSVYPLPVNQRKRWLYYRVGVQSCWSCPNRRCTVAIAEDGSFSFSERQRWDWLLHLQLSLFHRPIQSGWQTVASRPVDPKLFQCTPRREMIIRIYRVI